MAGFCVIITTSLTVGSSIAVLRSLRYHLSGMDLRRLTPLGLKGPPVGAGGGEDAPIDAAQSSSHGEPGAAAAAHSFSCIAQTQEPPRLPPVHSHRKTSVIKCDCDVLIKKY